MSYNLIFSSNPCIWKWSNTRLLVDEIRFKIFRFMKGSWNMHDSSVNFTLFVFLFFINSEMRSARQTSLDIQNLSILRFNKILNDSQLSAWMKKSKPPDDTMNHSLSTRSDSLSDYSHLNHHKYSVREEPRITTVLSPQTRTTRYECIWTRKNGEIEGTDSLLAEASSLVAWTATLLLCASAPEFAMADRLLHSHKATYKLQLCRVDKSQI